MTDEKIVPAIDDYAAINANAAKLATEKAAAIANIDVNDTLAAGATVKIKGEGGGRDIFSPGPTPYAKRQTQHLAERDRLRANRQERCAGFFQGPAAWPERNLWPHQSDHRMGACGYGFVTGVTPLTDDQLTFAGRWGSICEHIHPGRKVLGISLSQER